MIEFKNKVLSVVLNFLLLIWMAPTVIIGIIGLLIFRNYEIYRNEDAGIIVLAVDKGYLFGNACFSAGPIIFVTPNCNDDTLRHETGHSVQALYLGPLFHFAVSLPSIIRFWIRRWCNKSYEWYLSSWPEGGSKFCAEELGHTKRSQIKNNE